MIAAGFGLPVADSLPAKLEKALKAKGLNVTVENAGVSGDTSAGGVRRLDWALDGDVRVLVVALGGNDALRALPTEELKQKMPLAKNKHSAHDGLAGDHETRRKQPVTEKEGSPAHECPEYGLGQSGTGDIGHIAASFKKRKDWIDLECAASGEYDEAPGKEP